MVGSVKEFLQDRSLIAVVLSYMSQLVQSGRISRSQTQGNCMMMLRNIKDSTSVAEANIGVKTGSKWSAVKAVTEVENSLQHKDIAGLVTEGRKGLGNQKNP